MKKRLHDKKAGIAILIALIAISLAEIIYRAAAIGKAVAGEHKDEGMIRKVEKFNEEYRLKEKGAILNWFDITEVEGYFSLTDKMSDIMATMKGKLLFATMFAKMMPKKGEKMMGGFEMNDTMMGMLGGFTVLRLSGMMGMAGINLTKEQLLDLNAKLNKIKKPRK